MAAAQVLHRARRHAVQVAARVAVVFGLVHLARPRAGGGLALAATRLAAVAAVPLILVSVQSASPTRQLAALAPRVLQTPHPDPPPQGGRERAPSPSQAGRETAGTPGSLLPGSPATLKSAIDTVRRLLRPLPSVPPVIGTPPALPSIPLP
jgi:hypothetical protein